MAKQFKRESASGASFQHVGGQHNPDFVATDPAGYVDTFNVPWVEYPGRPGNEVKILRVSADAGSWTCIRRLLKGTRMPRCMFLGSADFYLLTGRLRYDAGGEVGANAFLEEKAGAVHQPYTAVEDTTFLANYYGPVACIGDDGGTVDVMESWLDAQQLALRNDVHLCPTTLGATEGKAEKRSYDSVVATKMGVYGKLKPLRETGATDWLELEKVPWVTMGFGNVVKVLRVDEQTGKWTIYAKAKKGTVNPRHYHFGASDAYTFKGSFGYRNGPAVGIHPGTYTYEPAGALHAATTSLEDVEYIATFFGATAFYGADGKSVSLVQSFMDIKKLFDFSRQKMAQAAKAAKL